MQPGDGMQRAAQPTAPAVALLGRVRRLFLVLAWLLLAVEVVELLDARTVLWPQRATAAAALMAMAAALGVVGRTERVGPWLDATSVACVLAVGWGLGRVGAVLALLLGVGLLRTLYGSRRSVAIAVGALLLAYAGVGVLLGGPGELLDLGYVVVSLGLGGFAWVIRQVAEAVARHDVAAAWDRALAAAAHRLLSASSPAEIDAELGAAAPTLNELGRNAAGGLLVVPDATLAPDGHEPHAAAEPRGAQDPDGTGQDDAPLETELHRRLLRLATDARLARSLLSSEARYRSLAEDSRDGIYLRSAANATAFHYVNEAGRRLLGDVDRPGAPGIDLGRLHPEDRSMLVDQLRSGRYVATPVRIRLLDPAVPGEVRWVELVETPASTVAGTLRTVQGTVRDVTAGRREEQAMQAAVEHERSAAERLRTVDELRSTFLAAVSHELRTPLAGLLGASQTLAARNGRLSPEQSHDLAAIVDRQSERLVGLLDDLLDVERLSRGQVEMASEPTDLLALARRVVANFEDRDVVVTVDGDQAVVVDVDPCHIERILHNLLRNARKHAPAATSVRVSVRAEEGGARLVVEDDGPGVPARLRGALFEPFVQGPGASASPSPGTGIGLSLVRKFAELHGGRAWVEESPAGGARFVVLLSGRPPASMGAAADDATAGLQDHTHHAGHTDRPDHTDDIDVTGRQAPTPR